MSGFVSEIDLEKLQGWADGWQSIMTLDIPYSRCQELEMSGKDEVSIKREVASIRCDLQSAMSIGVSTVVCMDDLSANERNHIRVAGKAEATEKEHWPSHPQTIRFSMYLHYRPLILAYSNHPALSKRTEDSVIFEMHWARRSLVQGLPRQLYVAAGRDPPRHSYTASNHVDPRRLALSRVDRYKIKWVFQFFFGDDFSISYKSGTASRTALRRPQRRYSA